jgi:hypothetical protein
MKHNLLDCEYQEAENATRTAFGAVVKGAPQVIGGVKRLLCKLGSTRR